MQKKQRLKSGSVTFQRVAVARPLLSVQMAGTWRIANNGCLLQEALGLNKSLQSGEINFNK